MDESVKLTREELEKIITEELRELDEGILSRMMAKISATGAGAKVSAGNIAKKVLNVGLRAFDAPELKMLNPKVIKQMTIVSNRLTKAGKQMNKIYADIENDLTKLVNASEEKEVWNAANKIIGPALAQAKEASGAMMGVGAAFKKSIPANSAKGNAEKAGALAESKKQKKTVKIKVLKERKDNG